MGKYRRVWSVVKATMVPGGDAGLPDAAEEDVAGQHVHHHGSKREEDLHTGPDDLAGHLAADFQIGQTHVLVVEAGHFAVLSAEEAGEHDAGHGQGLLGDGGHLGGGLLDPGRGGAAAFAHQVAEDREDRGDARRNDGQFPRQHGHGDQGADEDDHVGQDVADGAGHHHADAGDVVGNAALDLAGALGGEEAQGQRLEMRVQTVTQVAHHPLAHLLGEPGLEHAQAARHHDHRGHGDGQRPEQGQVGPAVHEEGGVEHHPDQDRVDDAQAGGDQDQQADGEDARPVGLERLCDPPVQMGDAPAGPVATGTGGPPETLGHVFTHGSHGHELGGSCQKQDLPDLRIYRIELILTVRSCADPKVAQAFLSAEFPQAGMPVLPG